MKWNVAIVTMMVVLLGCGSDQNPEPTIQAFSGEIAAGNTLEAVSMTRPKLAEAKASFVATKLSRLTAYIQKSGGMKSVTANCSVVGDTSSCQTQVEYNSGKSETVTYSLIRQDGRWYIDNTQF